MALPQASEHYDYEDLQVAVHELSVYRAELEAQNDELRAVQGELGEARDRYADLFDHAPVGIMQVDSGAVIRSVNQEGARLLGRSRCHIEGTALLSYVDAGGTSRFLQLLAQARREGSVSDALSLRRRSGGVVYVQVDVIRVEGGALRLSMADVTRRHEAEERLMRSEARLRAVLDGVGEAVVTVGEDGAVSTVNPAAERLFACSAAEMVGRSVRLLVALPPSRRDQSVLDVITAGEVTAFVRGGATRIVALCPGVLDGQVGREAVLLLRDVTEKRRLDEELIEVAERVQRHIGRDLHDGLGQVLVGVSLLARQLQQKLDLRGASEASDAARLVHHLQDVVEESKNIARRLHPLELEVNGLMWALKKVALDVEVTGVKCRVRWLDDDLATSPFVATNLYRIVQEAVGNALKHAHPRSITITVGTVDGVGTLVVQDDGRGLPDDFRAGCGMGLRTMAHRARVLEGTLDVQPASPCGTAVHCTFRPTLQREEGRTAL